MNPDEKKQIEEIVDLHVAQLGEHFDSVRIFVTRHRGQDQSTASYDSGSGNFFAQLGQVGEWVAINDQFQRNYAIRKDAQ